MPSLTITSPDADDAHYRWDEGSIGMGRDAANHVILADPRAARWHAAIFEEPGPSYRLRALGQRCATRVNESPTRSRVLDDGDVIRVGDWRLTFHAPAAAAAARASLGRLQLTEDVDPIGLDPETRELQGPDWGEAGWGREHDGGPPLSELFWSIQAVAATLDVDELLETLVIKVEQYTTPSLCFAALVDPDSSLDVRAQRTDLTSQAERIPFSESTVRRAIESRLPIRAAAVRSTSFDRLGILRALCLPLVSNRTVRGIVYADWRRMGEKPIADGPLEWLAALTMFAGSAFENALYHERLRSRHERLRRSNRSRTQIIGVSRPTRALLDDIERCAASSEDVLITGETGTGKELVARRIHERSARHDGPFVAVNCASIPEQLFDSEMFGHRRGAFTCAVTDRKGRFQEANGGTLFLDEIGELAANHQARLLRGLQEKVIDAVGSDRPVALDLRVIAATNRDLRKAVAAGAFREDLYNRLGLPLATAPLRDRPEDIPILAYYLLDRLTIGQGEAVREIAPRVMQTLTTYRWPGNVRELSACLRNAIVFSDDRVTVSDLRRNPEVIGRAKGLPRLDEIEADHVRLVMRATAGNKSQAAKILGVAENTLSAKMKRYGIRRDDYR
ncbi:MAG: sigma 54-interacting transcriptional regulator [Candidatus Eisenbacteria bacterium]|nr:sigma 54-interacting transcriptional regulator [Candidatus Eisenbacteria bacterium]